MHHPFAAQVDPRTGLLQFRLPLVTAIGNDHLGPEFALSLNYSLLDLEDVGYGKGFSANLSRYDPVSRLLTLSNGEQYRLDGNESEPAFSPPAPLHLRLKKGNEALWVYYKSGVVEQLIIPQAKGVAQKHYLLNRVFSPTGHEIIFTYVALNGRLRLAQIKDAQQTLVEIDWTALSQVNSQTPSPHQIQLTVWPGLPQSHRVFLLKKQGTLTQVSKYDNFDTTHCGAGAICQLGYDHQDRLVSLRLPGGINESFTYCADGAVRPQPCIESIGIYTFIVIPVITLQNDFNLSVGGIDSRLTRRYQTLVKQHMTPAALLASAVKDLASAQKSTFATTQAVWRFLNNKRISFSQLNEPIISLALEQISLSPHPYALVVHDWSRLQFLYHHAKYGRLKMTHGGDVGYELQS